MPEQTDTVATPDHDNAVRTLCGEVGTSWPGGEPMDTPPCALPDDHDTEHDWAIREAAAGLDRTWADILGQLSRALTRDTAYASVHAAYLHGVRHGNEYLQHAQADVEELHRTLTTAKEHRDTAQAQAAAADAARRTLVDELAEAREQADKLVNELLAVVPESWDDDVAPEHIAITYLREIERRLILAGGSLERWPDEDDAPPAGLGSSPRAQGDEDIARDLLYLGTLPPDERDYTAPSAEVIAVATGHAILHLADVVSRLAPAAPAAAVDQDAVDRLLATAREGLAAADSTDEQVEIVSELLAAWYAAWPATAVTDPDWPIAGELVAMLTPPAGAEPTRDRYAEGYAAAVAVLRDDARYDRWRTSTDVQPTLMVRQHLADYLVTVGPDGPDVEAFRSRDERYAAIVADALRNAAEGYPVFSADRAAAVAVQALADRWAFGPGARCIGCGEQLPRATGGTEPAQCQDCWLDNPGAEPTNTVETSVDADRRYWAELARLRGGLIDRNIGASTDAAGIVDAALTALDRFLVVIDRAVNWRGRWTAERVPAGGRGQQLAAAIDELLNNWPGVNLGTPAVSIAEVHAEQQDLAQGTAPVPDVYAGISQRLELRGEPGPEEQAPVDEGHARTMSSVIAVNSRYGAVGDGGPAGGELVRLPTGGGRTYEGWRSETCPGDGVTGHRHDIRCVDERRYIPALSPKAGQ